MKKVAILFIILLTIMSTAQQDKNALALIKLEHDELIEQRLNQIKEIKQLENPEKAHSKALETELYKKLIQVYTGYYSPDDITNVLAFYESDTGKKVLESQTKIQAKVATTLFDWEMEQQGISITPPPEPPLIENEAQLLEQQQNQRRDSIVPKPMAFPKITNLEDLKKLVKKEPYLIGDQRLLLEIIGQEAFDTLFNFNTPPTD